MTQKNSQMQTLAGHYSYARLFRSTTPCVIMLVVTSIYSVVDGLFVSNFVGKTPFTAVNFIFPLLMILGGVGFMFGTGGGALIAKTLGEHQLIAKTLGEHQKERADAIFSMTVYVAAGCGVVLMILGLAFLRPVAVAMGAQGQLLDDSLIYGGVYLLGLPGCVLQYAFQNLCATAGKPKLGLYVTVAAGVTNIQTQTGAVCHGGGRCDQHRAGRPVCGGVLVGACRCCGGFGAEPVHRRHCSAGLLPVQEFQPAAAEKMPLGSQGAGEDLHQWLF